MDIIIELVKEHAQAFADKSIQKGAAFPHPAPLVETKDRDTIDFDTVLGEISRKHKIDLDTLEAARLQLEDAWLAYYYAADWQLPA